MPRRRPPTKSIALHCSCDRRACGVPSAVGSSAGAGMASQSSSDSVLRRASGRACVFKCGLCPHPTGSAGLLRSGSHAHVPQRGMRMAVCHSPRPGTTISMRQCHGRTAALSACMRAAAVPGGWDGSLTHLPGQHTHMMSQQGAGHAHLVIDSVNNSNIEDCNIKDQVHDAAGQKCHACITAWHAATAPPPCRCCRGCRCQPLQRGRRRCCRDCLCRRAHCHHCPAADPAGC